MYDCELLLINREVHDDFFYIKQNEHTFCFGFGFRPSGDFFTHMEHHYHQENVHILTYARQISSVGYLSFHTYCNNGHMIVMVISEYSWHWYLLSSVWLWSTVATTTEITTTIEIIITKVAVISIVVVCWNHYWYNNHYWNDYLNSGSECIFEINNYWNN